MVKEYKIEPYPRRLWIIKDEIWDDIKSQFTEIDGDITHEYLYTHFDAYVSPCKKDGYLGYLLFIPDEVKDHVLVHEAGHITIFIYEDCDMELKQKMDSEPFCYLLEYIYKLMKNGLGD